MHNNFKAHPILLSVVNLLKHETCEVCHSIKSRDHWTNYLCYSKLKKSNFRILNIHTPFSSFFHFFFQLCFPLFTSTRNYKTVSNLSSINLCYGQFAKEHNLFVVIIRRDPIWTIYYRIRQGQPSLYLLIYLNQCERHVFYILVKRRYSLEKSKLFEMLVL